MRLFSLICIALCFALCVASTLLPAQTLLQSSTFVNPAIPPTVRVGVVGGADFTLHMPNFMTIPGYKTTFALPYITSPDIPNDMSFRSGFTASLTLGALLEIPFDESFMLGLRGMIASHGGTLRATQRFETTDANNNFYTPTLEHTLSFALSTASAEATALWKPLPNVLVSLGLAGAVPLEGRAFVQSSVYDKQGDPGPVQFKASSVSGDLPLAGFMLSALGGLAYELPVPLGVDGIAGRVLFVPEIVGMLGINPVLDGFLSGNFWNMAQIRAGIALKYEFPRQTERREHYEWIDTVRIVKTRESLVMASLPDSLVIGNVGRGNDTVWAGNLRTIKSLQRRTDTLITTKIVLHKPAMHFSIAALGVQPDGKETALPEIRIEEIIGQKYFPLLNYVFFAERSAEIPSRYVRLTQEKAASFQTTRLRKGEALALYHNILNVLGERMKRLPEATLTLMGCNANVGTEKGNLVLSEARAKAVKQYLCDVGSIAPERIITKARNLSEKPSLPSTETDKSEENRRVEISASAPEILEWLIVADTVRTASPPTARILTQTETEREIRSWRLTITHKSDTVRTFDSAGAPPPTLDWDFAKEARIQGRDLALLTEPFVINPELTDTEGNVIQSEAVSLPIKQITVQKKRRERRKDKEFEEFSMMLFEFDESRTSAAQQYTIDFIKTHIKPYSDLAVVGYTDRTGTAEYDRKLSLERAKQIARTITGEENPSEQVVVRGVGKDELLFDNAIPEGRFYCRTVKVTIETVVSR